MTTLAPSATKSSAVLRPMPLVAPVMIAILPSSLPMSSFLSNSGERPAALRQPLQEGRRCPQRAVLLVEAAHGLVDLGRPDAVGIVHRPAAPARARQAVEPPDFPFARPHGDRLV